MFTGANALDNEIATVNALSRGLVDEYLAWGDKIKIGEVQQMMYNEIIEFVNFRIETADTCLLVVQNGRVADALGLCRSLLEHYLLLMLICRGRKTFRLQDLASKTEGEFKQVLAEREAKLAEQHAAGEALTWLEVRRYPRAKRHLMYVFEGLKADGEPDLVVPLHYFVFQDFHPEAMRLKPENYFTYMPLDADLTKMAKEHQQHEAYLYRHFLSYDALIQCLELNGLLGPQAQARLEAHYTFLGKYLHPTHDAARELRERSNIHDGRPVIGMGQPYSKVAVLLASLYVCYCLSGLLEEVTRLHEQAPARFIADPGTTSLRSLIGQVAGRFPYFWFLFNEAPLYDKFKYAGHHLSDEDLATYGHYSNVPSELVPFEHDIYDRLKKALMGWPNNRCGPYYSPLQSGDVGVGRLKPS